MVSTALELEQGPDYQPQKRLLSFAIPKKVYPIPTKNERTVFPKAKASFLSRVFFWYMVPLMTVGYARTLTETDLYDLSDDIKVQDSITKFERIYAQHLEIVKKKHLKQKAQEAKKNGESFVEKEALKDLKFHQARMLYVLLLTFKRTYIEGTLLCSVNAVAVGVTPIVSRFLTQFVEDRISGRLNTPTGRGIGYALAFSIILFIEGLALYHFLFRCYVVGFLAKSVLMNSILKKSFKLNAASRNKYPNSKITSLMATDLSRVSLAILTLPFLFVTPILTTIAIVFLAINLGIGALIGVGFFIVFIASTSYAATKLFAYRNALSGLTDHRVSLTSELIHNLRMIKLYSWEIPYFNSVMKARAAEIKVLMKMQTVRNIFEAVSMSVTGIASMITFIVIFLIDGKTKGAATTFSSLSAFGTLSNALAQVPEGLSTLADLLMGLKRVSAYLLAEEIEPNPNYILEHNPDSQMALALKDASFEWETFDKKVSSEDEKTNEKSSGFSLKNVDLVIRKNEFVVITGPIGSGKSSLLNAMTGTMPLKNGTITVNGSLLFCDQPWVQNATIKENILFGKPYHESRYNHVIFACALQGDLDDWEAGDLTEVGERGITLSGGQKARINLARAIYADRDIILLDDVLSAVDAKVGKHIIKHCFNDLLSARTIVLATHQMSLVESANRIVFMNEDNTIEVDTPENLKIKNASYRNLLSFSVKEEIKEEKEPAEIEEIMETEIIESSSDSREDQQIVRRKNGTETFKVEEGESFIEMAKDLDESKGKIVEAESKAVNGVQFKVYKIYLEFGSKSSLLAFLTLVGLTSLTGFLSIFSNTWLSFWVQNQFHQSDKFYIGLYVAFNISWVVSVCALFVYIAKICTTSSKNMNVRAIQKVLHAPMAFLDITPIGRILNRFTKDTDALDNEISEMYKYSIMALYTLVGTFVLIIVYLPAILAIIPVLVILFVGLLNYSLASTREIKRSEAIKRSYVYNNFNESLGGRATIQNYNTEKRFIELSNELNNGMNEATLMNYATQTWLCLELEIISMIFVLIVTFLCVTRAFKVNAATVGLLINYTIELSNTSALLIRTYARLETSMNSVERVSEYATELVQEASYEIQATQPDSSWPSSGAIEFKNVSMAYRPGLPLVLRNISFAAAGGEKIGICGRTGAGKSSIMTALYRISELDTGDIYIDGVDISKIGLKDLRSHLSIIPQDPVLFNGSIRKNLDPFDEHSDDVVWDALRRSGLISLEVLEETKRQTTGELHKFHISQEVQDNGANFSLGEKQLIAFSRALIRDTRILIMDEATSSVDYETDSKIQHTIANEFSHCTILCVAHRLKTIISYDRIMTLDKGEINAIGKPLDLFNNEDSIFRQLCDKSGITASDF